MADRPRHLATASPAPSSDTPPPSCTRTVAGLDYPKGIPWDVADSVVHQLLRVPAPFDSSQRSEPWPVADQRHSAPLGEPAPPSNVVALFRDGGLPNIGRRS